MPTTARECADRQPISVLVVDDFPDGRDLLTEYLSFRGFDVHAARDGAEAVEMTRTLKPHIVLLDLGMPGMNGWEVARHLKSDPDTASITVIAVTAHALTPQVELAKESGCDGVICKPFDLTALGDALPRVLTDGAKALDVPGLSLTASRGRKKQSRSAEGV